VKDENIQQSHTYVTSGRLSRLRLRMETILILAFCAKESDELPTIVNILNCTQKFLGCIRIEHFKNIGLFTD